MLLVVVVRVGGRVSKLVVGVAKVVALQLRTIEKRSQLSLSIGEKKDSFWEGGGEASNLMVEHDQLEALLTIYKKKMTYFINFVLTKNIFLINKS